MSTPWNEKNLLWVVPSVLLMIGSGILGVYFYLHPTLSSLSLTLVPRQDHPDHTSSGRTSRVFTVRNTGRKDLEIARISIPCGCMRVDMDTRRIAAGGSAALTVSLDPSYRTLQEDERPTVVIESTDPQGSPMILDMKGYIP